MGQGRFPRRIDIEADIIASLVVNNIPSVKDGGGLDHSLEDLLKVKVPVQIPLR